MNKIYEIRRYNITNIHRVTKQSNKAGCAPATPLLGTTSPPTPAMEDKVQAQERERCPWTPAIFGETDFDPHFKIYLYAYVRNSPRIFDRIKAYGRHVGMPDAESILHSILPYIRGDFFIILGGGLRSSGLPRGRGVQELCPLHLTISSVYHYSYFTWYFPWNHSCPPLLLQWPRLWVI